MNIPILEVCANSLASALAAQKGRAYRVELCDNLYEGGTTPSPGCIKLAREELNIKLNVLIRPRGGDFLYSDDEMEIIRRDIQYCKQNGVDGVVIGFLTPDGDIDVDSTSEVIKAAHPLSVTFHRAFDMCKDQYKALDELMELKIDRILTSGQKNSALQGAERISELVEIAGDKVIIMPGAGLKPENIRNYHLQVRAKEYHATLHREIESGMKYRKPGVYMGGTPMIPEYTINQTDPEKVRRFIKALGEAL
ncbi:copper homeostasis protein CutC [Candidatus Bathyarchaeota archaeon]|nr:copper homeostasis protein CutC [Candidatus Bathyarchaeota archaeon]